MIIKLKHYKMDNIAILLKGFLLTLLAWIGIQVASSHPEHLILTIKYYSPGWFLLFIMPMISLIWGINSLWKFLSKKYKQFQNKNLDEINKRCDA